MKMKMISWYKGNFDFEWDRTPAPVEHECGNKGMGGLVFAFCLVAILLPSTLTVIQINKGTAKGNPWGAIIAVVLILSWPLYWGLKQFFLKRQLEFSGDKIKIILISLFGKKKCEIKIQKYGQIEYGRTSSYARTDSGPGSTGRYFVCLPHRDKNRAIILYQKVREQMEEERLRKYADLFNLPVVNITPAQTDKDARFKQKVNTILAERKKT